MIEAWWRSLKHRWLFLHSLESVATIRRLVAFYVHEHNHVLPHSAFRGQTPDEMYLRHRGRSAGGPDVTRGRRAPSARGGQPIGVVQDVPVSQRGRMTGGGLTAVPTHRPLAGVRLASCPGLLPIRTGSTRLLERGRDRRANRTVRVQREDAAERLWIRPAVPCRIEWRELARKKPECP